MAAIPNNPSVYNPYNEAGHTGLIKRKNKVLDDMVDMKYITQAQADAAKQVDVLAEVQPAESQEEGKSPHFVNMVKDQLNAQLGKTVVGNGGLTVKTTLDLTMQGYLEQGMDDLFTGKIGRSICGIDCPTFSGFRNGAAAIEDTQTGQVLALIGSKGYDTPGYGQNNAATAYLQPGSSIKPFVYAQLFQNNQPAKPTGVPGQS